MWLRAMRIALPATQTSLPTFLRISHIYSIFLYLPISPLYLFLSALLYLHTSAYLPFTSALLYLSISLSFLSLFIPLTSLLSILYPLISPPLFHLFYISPPLSISSLYIRPLHPSCLSLHILYFSPSLSYLLHPSNSFLSYSTLNYHLFTPHMPHGFKLPEQ